LEAGTLVRALAGGALPAATPPVLVEVVVCADAPADGLCEAGCRGAAGRCPALRRCRALRLAALPRRAMGPLRCVFRVAVMTAREAVAGR